MATSGIQVKGSGFVHTLDYLEAEYGLEVVQDIYGAMTPEGARTVKRALVMTMYPVEYVGELLDAIKAVLGQQDPEIVYKISLAAAKASFSTLYKIFFRLGRPGYIIGKAASVFDRFTSEGRLEVTESEKKMVSLRLVDFGYQHHGWCNHRLRGWYQAPLELSGCRITESVHHTCVLRGDSHCAWRYRW